MKIKATKGYQYSTEELALLDAARPKPRFESVRFDEYALFYTYKENKWRLSFKMFDDGMAFNDPLDTISFDRIDIIDRKTGKILIKDCCNDKFIYETYADETEMIGASVIGPELPLSQAEYIELLKQNACLVIRNIVFSNGVVDLVADRFLCPLTPIVEYTTQACNGEKKHRWAPSSISLRNVGYRFSEQLSTLSREERCDFILNHPDVVFEKYDYYSMTISKDTCPDASLFFSPDSVKQAFENGDTVEAAVIKAHFSDKSACAPTGRLSYDAVARYSNRNGSRSEKVTVSHNTGKVDSDGRISFDIILARWASKEEAESQLISFCKDFDGYITLKVSTGVAEEEVCGGLGYDPDFLTLSQKTYGPDTISAGLKKQDANC